MYNDAIDCEGVRESVEICDNGDLVLSAQGGDRRVDSRLTIAHLLVGIKDSSPDKVYPNPGVLVGVGHRSTVAQLHEKAIGLFATRSRPVEIEIAGEYACGDQRERVIDHRAVDLVQQPSENKPV